MPEKPAATNLQAALPPDEEETGATGRQRAGGRG